METSDIYQKYLIDDFLRQVMSYRDEWRSGMWIQRKDCPDDLLSICSVEPRGELLYASTMNEVHRCLRRSLILVAFALAKHTRNATALSFHTLTKRSVEEFFASPVKQDPLKVCSRTLEDNLPIPMLGLGESDDMTLFLFRENSLRDILPNDLLDLLLSQPGIAKVSFVTFSEKGARSAILNARFLEDSHVKGYEVYSYQEFIEDEFGEGEWEKLSSVLERAKEAAYYYCGISVVKAVRPSSLRSFKGDIEDNLLARVRSLGLPDAKMKLLGQRFNKERAYRALTGSSDFARSYMTGEWLCLSLKSACQSPFGEPSIVDLTPIVSSYFKSIEQFLYDFVSLHTRERDGKNRKLFINSRWERLDPSSGYDESVEPIPLDGRGFADVTDALMSPAFKERLSLKTLIDFLGSKRTDGTYRPNYNADLLVDGASDGSTYHMLIDALEKVRDRRNGFFHKDNLYDWSVVEEVRELVTLAFYLLLGAVRISAEEEANLGFNSSGAQADDFTLLCDLVYEKEGLEDGGCIPEDGVVRVPVYYINDSPVPYVADSDPDATFNEDGSPLHSSIFLKELGPEPRRSVKLDRNNLPSLLYRGYLEIGGDGSRIELNLSEQKTPIFKGGAFCGPGGAAL